MLANWSGHGTAARWKWPRSRPGTSPRDSHGRCPLDCVHHHACGGTRRSKHRRSVEGGGLCTLLPIGALARSHQPEALYDFAALHRAQVSLVPASAPELFVPVYPPQTALFFAPFSVFPFRQATLLWNLVTLAAFALIVRRAWRPVAGLLPDSPFVIAAAAAFPPFWSLMLHGQTTALVLVAFSAGWLALERQRSFLAGMAFGLLLVKPQFAIPLAVLVLAFREWKMLAGAVTSIVLQVVSTAILLGTSVLVTYVKFIPVILKNSDMLEPKHYQNHSLRALTRLTPAWMDLPLWLILCAAVLATLVSVWKTSAPMRVRFGLVILASVLVSPHLLIYDRPCSHCRYSGSPRMSSNATGRRSRQLSTSACTGSSSRFLRRQLQ